jgi:peptidoglycan/LPS O-acetylase OafA/YrhL
VIDHSKPYYAGFDVLRFVAILFVILHHYFFMFEIGWVGVDLFFVLSGFLITDQLSKITLTPTIIFEFYIRRALRIFPLYYLTFGLFYVFSPVLFSDKNIGSTYHYYADNQMWFWFLLQNWLFVKKGFPPVPYLTHFWSLAVEWQFYLAWPLIILFSKTRFKLKGTILLLIAFAFGVRTFLYLFHPNNVEIYYMNTLCRMDSLLVGSYLAVHLSGKGTITKMALLYIVFILLVLLLTSWICFKSVNNDVGLIATAGYTLIALTFAALLYCFLTDQALLYLTIQPINFIGKISYGIYVFHLPVYLIVSTKFSILTGQFFNMQPANQLIIAAISFIITLAVSAGSYYLFESPIRQIRIFRSNFR